MATVRYQMSASKNYSYQNGVLVNTPVSLNVSFTADVPDPETAGLTPYYRTQGASDLFFQSILGNGNLKFVGSSMEPSLGQDRDNQYCAWTETYSKITTEQDLYDTNISVNIPTWRLNFIDLVDHDDVSESRRLRQAYGLTPVSGSISMKSKKKIDNWEDVFVSYNSDKFIIDSSSVTEGWQNGELIYSINISWKAYDLRDLPRFKENL